MAPRHFPARLKAARQARGWTQARLAQAVGLSREQIARYETAPHDPPLSTLATLAKALRVTVGQLVD
jgi:transcriptional regulator with XRE-family HTH domain